MAPEHPSLAAHLRSLANPIGGPLEWEQPSAERWDEGAAEGPPLTEHLQEQIDHIDELRMQPDTLVDEVAAGRRDDVQATTIAMQRADVSFRLLMAVRRKLLDAHDEAKRTRI